jgi:hypothetical protein
LARIFAFCACELRLTPEAAPRGAAGVALLDGGAARAAAGAAPSEPASAAASRRAAKRLQRARSSRGGGGGCKRVTRAAAAAARHAGADPDECGAFSDACSADDAHRRVVDAPVADDGAAAAMPPRAAVPRCARAGASGGACVDRPAAIRTRVSAPCVAGFSPRCNHSTQLPRYFAAARCSGGGNACGGGVGGVVEGDSQEREALYLAILAPRSCPAPPMASSPLPGGVASPAWSQL